MGFLILGFFIAIFGLNETHPQLLGQASCGTNLLKYLRTLRSNRSVETHYARLEQERALTNPPDNEQGPGNPSLELHTFYPLTENNIQQMTLTFKQTPYTSQIIVQVFSVSALAFHKVSSDIVIPVFLSSTSVELRTEGLKVPNFLKFTRGFGMTTAEVGTVLLTQAIAAILVQVFVSSRTISRFGALRTYRGVLHIFPCMYLLTPFTVILPRPFDLVALLLDLWTKSLLVGLGYNCSAIL